jgi:tRNA pseudouridine(55) synthase
MIFEYKELGETTLEFTDRLKKKYKVKKLGICGKLDPMAHGLITILIENETKLMSNYLQSIKIYKFSIIEGFSTDTDDIMGLIIDKKDDLNVLKSEMIYKYCSEVQKQKYHKFSGFKIRIDNEYKPLHYFSKSDNINIPEKDVKVYNIIELEPEIISGINYKNIIFNKLSKISEINNIVFRINDIQDKYKNHVFNEYYNKYTFIISVSSGFFIRMISNYIINNYNINCHISDIERIDIHIN